MHPVTYIDVDGVPVHPPASLMSVPMPRSVDSQPEEIPRHAGFDGRSGLQSFAAVWSTGLISGAAVLVMGVLMIALTSDLAAVVFWPLGTFAIIIGTTVLCTTLAARRATRNLANDFGIPTR